MSSLRKVITEKCSVNKLYNCIYSVPLVCLIKEIGYESHFRTGLEKLYLRNIEDRLITFNMNGLQ
jgi:hypothetical protein